MYWLEYLFIFSSLQYLKDQRLPPLTFIPLQSVRVKPIMERLRTLGGTAKLVFDVIQYPFLTNGCSEESGHESVHKSFKNLLFEFVLMKLGTSLFLCFKIYLQQLACPSWLYVMIDLENKHYLMSTALVENIWIWKSTKRWWGPSIPSHFTFSFTAIVFHPFHP